MKTILLKVLVLSFLSLSALANPQLDCTPDVRKKTINIECLGDNHSYWIEIETFASREECSGNLYQQSQAAKLEVYDTSDKLIFKTTLPNGTFSYSYNQPSGQYAASASFTAKSLNLKFVNTCVYLNEEKASGFSVGN